MSLLFKTILGFSSDFVITEEILVHLIFFLSPIIFEIND